MRRILGVMVQLATCPPVCPLRDLRASQSFPRGTRGSADFQVCCIAGFQTRSPRDHTRPADLEIGDTAGLETCTTAHSRCLPPHEVSLASGGCSKKNPSWVVKSNR